MGVMYLWSNIKRVLFSVAKLLAYMYTYTHITSKGQLQSLFWVVSITSVHLRDIAERCCGPFSHRTCRYSHGISILLGLGTPLIVPLLCAISPLSRKEPKHAHAAWPTALPSLSFAIITSGLGKGIHGVIVFVGPFYSENGW